jgi:tight adherence protein C
VGRRARGLVGMTSDGALDRRAGGALVLGGLCAAVDRRAAVVVAAVVWAVGAVGDRRAVKRRRRLVVTELAEAVPLLQLAVAGGLTVRGALAAVVPWLDGPLGSELAAAVDRSRAGALADHLEGLADRVGPAVRPLAAALAAADRYGAPLQAPLAQLAIDAELAARRLDEDEARRVPVRLLFPLVVGVLPAFVLLTVFPLLVSSLQAVRSTGP